jgi:hypothetical protein
MAYSIDPQITAEKRGRPAKRFHRDNDPFVLTVEQLRSTRASILGNMITREPSLENTECKQTPRAGSL